MARLFSVFLWRLYNKKKSFKWMAVLINMSFHPVEALRATPLQIVNVSRFPENGGMLLQAD